MEAVYIFGDGSKCAIGLTKLGELSKLGTSAL